MYVRKYVYAYYAPYLLLFLCVCVRAYAGVFVCAFTDPIIIAYGRSYVHTTINTKYVCQILCSSTFNDFNNSNVTNLPDQITGPTYRNEYPLTGIPKPLPNIQMFLLSLLVFGFKCIYIYKINQ